MVLKQKLVSLWKRICAVAPFVSLALGCLAGAVWGGSILWALIMVIAGLLLARPPWLWRSAVIFLAVVVAWRSELLEKPVRLSLAETRSESVTGRLMVGRQVDPFTGERFGKLQVGEVVKKVIVVQATSYEAGEVLEVEGRFFVPSRERNPGVFSEVEAWQRSGISGGFKVRRSQHVKLRNWEAPFRWAENLRNYLRTRVVNGVPESWAGREVILAMVLGEKPARNSEVSRAFRESGAMHVFAVSGLHVTLVGSLLWMVLMNFPVPRRVGLFVVILGTIAYAFTTGLKPPAVRATVMGTCLLGAFFFRRRPSVFNALSLSLILVVLWRPAQVYEVGFQLSYGVLLMLCLGASLALRFTGRFAELDPFFPHRLLSVGQRRVLGVRKYLAGLGASSLAAWAGSMPMMLWHFGVVTPVAVLASVVLIPVTITVLGLAFLGALLGLIWEPLERGVNGINGGVATAGFYVADGCSKLPFGHWQSGQLSEADWVVFDTQNGGAASFLDVKGGVMVDVGNADFYHDELRGILARWRVDLEQVFLTHPDGDHVGALPLLLENGNLKRAVLPVERALSPSYREFLTKAQDQVELVTGEVGDRYELDDEVWVEILSVGSEEQSEMADHRMMVMKFYWKGWRILVTGDLGMIGELDLLKGGFDLSADVVLMGRHAWGVSGQHQFLKATGAKVVITSASRVPTFEMPPQRWVEHVRSQGYHLVNQWESGAVLMDFEDDELRVWSFLNEADKVVLQR